MDFDAWPEWANPREIQRMLTEWLGPELTNFIEIAVVAILIAWLFVKLVLVPMGFRRK